MTETGTIYALADPRHGRIRYIGQTVQALEQRLAGKYAFRVREWIAELRAAGLRPQIIALRENVPAGELLAAEREEITRIVAAGGMLLNEQAVAAGRELNFKRIKAERIKAWAELARAAIAALGGPVPPGKIDLTEAPDAYSMARWVNVRAAAGNPFGDWMERNRAVLQAGHIGQESASRFLMLTIWYMVAVHPWRDLASLGRLPLDDAAFIAWVGRDAEVRDALAFLASPGEGMLEKLSTGWHDPRREKTPGRMLGAVAAAYSGTPPEVIRPELAEALRGLADDHMLTRPMADLLMRLDPDALDTVFGKDIAAEMDRDLDLKPGTSGRVLRAFVIRSRFSYPGEQVRRAAARSAQMLPVVALPDYRGWSGPIIPAARAVSGSLVRAGLAEPDDMTRDEYLAYVRALWTPGPARGDDD